MSLNYGGSSDWTSNTAGLMLECLNNTEIAVHDAGNRVASLMYFEGGGANKITIGRNWAPWGAISNIILNGNVGIGTSSTSAKLHIEHSSTSTSPADGGLYVYNPSTGANNRAVIAARINNSAADRALYSLDVNNQYGWSMYILGSDTTNKLLRFNASWNGLGTDRLTIAYDGSTVINGSLNSGNLTCTGTLNVSELATFTNNIGIRTVNPAGYIEITGGYRMKIGHVGRWAANHYFCDTFMRFLSSQTASNEIAYFGYVDSYDDPVNRTMVLGIFVNDAPLPENVVPVIVPVAVTLPLSTVKTSAIASGSAPAD
jgi:hypothetical protein